VVRGSSHANKAGLSSPCFIESTGGYLKLLSTADRVRAALAACTSWQFGTSLGQVRALYLSNCP